MKKSNRNIALVSIWVLGIALSGVNLGIYVLGTKIIEQQSQAAFHRQNTNVVCLEWRTPLACDEWVTRKQYLMVIDDHFGRINLESNDEK